MCDEVRGGLALQENPVKAGCMVLTAPKHVVLQGFELAVNATSSSHPPLMINDNKTLLRSLFLGRAY